MGCGEFFVKTILFVSNLIFLLAGLALLGIGIYVQLQSSNVVSVANINIQVAPIVTMIIGGIDFLIAFFGCCGAIRESSCMLITYVVLMVLLVLLNIDLGILIFINLDKVLEEIPKLLNDAFTADQNTFHPLEQAFKCCGTTGANSYGLRELVTQVTLPPTCCAAQPCTSTYAYSGCNTVIGDLFHNFGIAIGSVAIVVAAVELVSAVFAICLSNHSQNKMRRARY